MLGSLNVVKVSVFCTNLKRTGRNDSELWRTFIDIPFLLKIEQTWTCVAFFAKKIDSL